VSIVASISERLVIVGSLPMTGTGKAQKFLLRDLARKAT